MRMCLCVFVPQEMLDLSKQEQQPAARDEASEKILPHQQSIMKLPASSNKHGIVRSISKPGSVKGAC